MHKDTIRSFTHFHEDLDVYTGDRSTERNQLQLEAIINVVLSEHKSVSYYQGFHDVATVFLLVTDFNADATLYLLALTSQIQLRSICSKDVQPVIRLLDFLFPLLGSVSPEFSQTLQDAHIPPFFSISWVIAWMSHDIPNLKVVMRLFDFLLVSHAAMPLYVVVAILLLNQKRILNFAQPGVDFANIHHFLREVPRTAKWSLENIEEIIVVARHIAARHPPSKILSPDVLADWSSVEAWNNDPEQLIDVADLPFAKTIATCFGVDEARIVRAILRQPEPEPASNISEPEEPTSILPAPAVTPARPAGPPTWVWVAAVSSVVLVGAILYARTSTNSHLIQ